MDKYICSESAYVYDPDIGDTDNGIAPGTPFEKLPKEWVCPTCGATQDKFEKLPQEEINKLTQDGFKKYL